MDKQKKDNRSKKFVFVPFCLMCQAFQARGIVRYDWRASINPIMQELLDNEINIIQMPCPESQFGGYEKGLKREPKGLSGYDVPEFRELCDKLALETMEKIKAIINNDYEIVCILGIEMSPSCAVNYQYTNKGMLNKSGIFMEYLQNYLKKEKLSIPIIGVNRRYINKSLEQLKQLIRKFS